jgi:hypothetical protein
MGLRLPWSWKMGPSDSSERGHFQEMLIHQSFPENTLFCGDAGFTGYDFWMSIMDHGHHFLIRVGANVRLLTKLGYYARECNRIVYVWPESAARKKQPPLVLRLIHLKSEKGGRLFVDQRLEPTVPLGRSGVAAVHTSLGNRITIPDSQTDLWSSHAAQPNSRPGVRRIGMVAAWSVDDPPVCREGTSEGWGSSQAHQRCDGNSSGAIYPFSLV